MSNLQREVDALAARVDAIYGCLEHVAPNHAHPEELKFVMQDVYKIKRGLHSLDRDLKYYLSCGIKF